MCSFDEFVNKHSAKLNFIAHCGEGEKPLLHHVYEKSSDSIILIGPEGDFSRNEVEKAIQKGYLPVSLGSSRLRTETAGIAACHTAALKNDV